MFAHAIAEMPRAQPRDAFTRFADGLDLETPPWTVKPGRLRDAMNYEIAVEDGYRDIAGYERFDGRPRPSDASFTILDVTISGSIEVGDTVEGVNTGATGLVIAIGAYSDTQVIGSFDPSSMSGSAFSSGAFGFLGESLQVYLVLTKVTGDFTDTSENLEVSAVIEGHTDAAGYPDSAATPKLKAQYKNLAADAYRDDIEAVPGEGSVWGVFTLGAVKYALRNKVGGLTAGLYESSAAGWVEVALGWEVAFTSGGTTEITEGMTLVGATSSAEAVVERVQLVSGTWAGGDAVGWFTLSGKTGNFQAENLNIDGGASNVATIAADLTAITLNPDGRLDYDVDNFANPQGSDRVYGATGVDYGFEFDGTVYVRIHTGMEDDTPDHVIVHKYHLFFSFDGSIQHSALGNPLSWAVVLGAAELATGERVTAFDIQPGAQPGSALLVACRQRFFILYGNDVSDWNLVRYRRKVGAYEWTLQQVAYTLCLDDRGITDFRTADTFGNFDHSSLSNLVRRLINAKRGLAVASCVVRDKNQYRLFFSDRSAIYVTMDGGKLKGMMPVTLGHQVVCTCSEEDPDGQEEIYFGADDGFVYQMEKGTSFDGDPIRAFLYTHFDHSKSIQTMKLYYSPVTVEGRGSGYAEFDLGYELSYGQSQTYQPDNQLASMPAEEGGAWDQAGLAWDTFIAWDQSSLVPTVGLDLRGEGNNISWVIVKDSDYFEPLLLSGVHFRYLPTVPLRA